MEYDNKHGGARKGAGRKPKSEEQELLSKLSPIENDALKALKKGISQNQSWAVKLYFEYRWGKAKETKDIKIELDNNLPDWLDE